MHSHTQPHATAATAAVATRRHGHVMAHARRRTRAASAWTAPDAVRDSWSRCATPGGPSGLPLSEALGRGLAEDITAPLDLPPFANSQMDGFAIRSADVPDGGAELRVAAPVPAGAAPRRCSPATAAPIMTGRHDPAGGRRRRPH